MLPHGHGATTRDGESYSRNSVAGDIAALSAAASKGDGVAMLRKEQNKSAYPCLEITCTDGGLNVKRQCLSERYWHSERTSR